MAAALADVNRYAYALVAVVLDGLDFAAPHCDGLPKAFGHLDFTIARTLLARVLEHVRSDLSQLRLVA